ncbi:YihY/virulence factor BrkB family protein [Enterococcus mediterraneensis]|uniref:YihY/virulence factor BrkB family protein n=1 Tax=Enterococcus mediterraneensis TaxID=2364791 RepID=UPI000F045CF6|nr:YihY/virulence factor BrkB family protein [Enterococcus mediterraneensis]
MNIIRKIKDNQTFMRFFTIAKRQISTSEVGISSIAVAYYLLLSLFPLMIVIGNLLPFLNIDPGEVLPYAKELIPEQVYQFIGPAIEDLLTQSSGGLLSISALVTIWSASQSVNALQKALNKAYGVDDRKNFIVVRLVSLITIIFFMGAIVGVALVLGFGKILLDILQPVLQFPDALIDTFQTVKWPLTIVILLIVLTIIYWLVPNAKIKLRSTLPGSIFATVGWMLLGQLFGLYAKYFASRISGYQIIGSFIVLMIWLNFAATIIIIGGVINGIFAEMKTGKELTERKDLVAEISTKLDDKNKDQD